jgi:Tol biopolymer transport system component
LRWKSLLLIMGLLILSPGIFASAVSDELKDAPLVNILADDEAVITFISADQPGGQANTYVMTPDGSDIRLLIPGYGGKPLWSPDGNALLIERFGLHILDVQTGQTSVLVGDKNPSHQSSWSPDGTHVAFVSQDTGNDEIYVVDMSTGEYINTTDDPGADFTPAWSPDSSQIAFASMRTGSRDIFVMSPDGDDPTALFSGGFNALPVWSPDGAYLTWSSDQTLLTLEVDTGSIQQLTPGDGTYTDVMPIWSPDGKWIAFYRQTPDDPRYNLYIMRPDGSDVQKLSEGGVVDSYSAWSPDSQSLIYQSTADNTVYQVKLETGERRALVQTIDYAALPAWRPVSQPE